MSGGNGNGHKELGIFVMPTEEGQPPRALFLDHAGGNTTVVGGVEYVDDAWRWPNGEEVVEEVGQAITEHAENLGVEWDH